MRTQSTGFFWGAALGLLLSHSTLHAQGAPQGASADSSQSSGAAQSSGASSGGLVGGGGAASSSSSSSSSLGGSSGPSTLYGLKPAKDPKNVPTYTLDQALQMASERNYDLRIAAEQIVQAQTMIRRAWSVVIPKLSASANYIYTTPETELSFMDQDSVDQQKQQLKSQALLLRSMADLTAMSDPDKAAELNRSARALDATADAMVPSDPITIQPAHMLTGNVQLTVPIFNPRTIPMIQNSYDMVRQAGDSLQRARQQALFGVATLYYSANTLKKMLAMTEENEASSQKHYDATQARVTAGTLPAIALKRAQFDLVKAQQTTRSTRSTYHLLLGTLGKMMGVDSMFAIVTPPEFEAVEAQGNAEAFYQRALKSRRDYRAAETAFRVAERGMTDYWMRYLPSLNMVGKANYTSNTGGFQTDPLTYNVVLAASIPIYDGGERYAVRDEAASKIRAANLSLEKTRYEMAGLVRGNLQDIQTRVEGLASARLAVELAKENHQNAIALFDVGAATNLEVIDASAAELGAGIDLARSELDLSVARMGLLFVVGEYPPLDRADDDKK